MRGSIGFFNLFDSTRYMVQMMITVVNELTPFFLVLFGRILVFSLILKNVEGFDPEFYE
jgi:hypothetical protein